jgi:low affinity Fe/Cu permease
MSFFKPHHNWFQRLCVALALIISSILLVIIVLSLITILGRLIYLSYIYFKIVVMTLGMFILAGMSAYGLILIDNEDDR